jgi:hypothetical protein
MVTGQEFNIKEILVYEEDVPEDGSLGGDPAVR